MIEIDLDLTNCQWSMPGRKVIGECDTSICKAVCCKISTWKGNVGEQCEFLEDDLKCKFHKRDIHCKPVSCLIWPTKNLDIEKVHEVAERLGFKERCLLRVE